MGGQIPNPITILKLQTTNSINPTNINNTNDHCRWLICIVGGCVTNVGILKWRNMRDLWETWRNIYIKGIWENEKRNLYVFEITENFICIWVLLLTWFCVAKLLTFKNVVLTSSLQSCYQNLYIIHKSLCKYNIIKLSKFKFVFITFNRHLFYS